MVFIYPTTKRWFKMPQIWLGATFNMGVMIGFAALCPGVSAMANL